jgi:indolepyruvate ferredoxin oxidoreductase
VRRRVAFLTEYQNAAYAQEYADYVAKVKEAEARVTGKDQIAKAVAKYLFKLMAYKDEYEVARLYTTGEFEQRLKAQFEGNFTLSFNLAPPLFSKKDANGHLVKARYGSWTWTAFRWLAKLRFLRGSAWDVFGRTEERRTERALIGQYRASLDAALARLSVDNAALALELANLPEHIRGFGHVKQDHLEKVRTRWRALDAELTGTKTATAQRAA